MIVIGIRNASQPTIANPGIYTSAGILLQGYPGTINASLSRMPANALAK